MKNIAIATIITIALSSCQSDAHRRQALLDSTNFDTTKTVALAKGNPALDSCLKLLDTTTAIVAKGVKKQITPAQANTQVKPMMIQYFALYKKLSPADTLLVYNYRIKKLNELVDLQVEANKAK